MPRLDVYITFWNNGNSDDGVEWMLSARSTGGTSPNDEPSATTFTYSIVLVAPGTDRWIEAHQTPADPVSAGSGKMMGALRLASSETLEHVDLETFDTFIKESDDAAAENPFPDRASHIVLSRSLHDIYSLVYLY